MRNWISSLFGSRESAAPVRVPPPAHKRETASAVRHATPRPEPPARSASLAADQVDFLIGLVDPPEPRPLDELPLDDRLFLVGIRKRCHSRKFDVAVLPEAAIKLGEMIRKTDTPVANYVALLDTDPALSVEVLKAANSAAYMGASNTTSLHEAVRRIGLNRLQSLLIMTHLTAKVLRGGAFHGTAELITDLSLTLSGLASKLARGRMTKPDLCFMRGTLLHVEHLVVLGTIADVSRDARRSVTPSVLALHQAFATYGPGIRQALGVAWKLEEVLSGGADETDLVDEYAGLRRALIWRWIGRPLPSLPGVDDGRLADVLWQIPPRVSGSYDGAYPPG